MLLYLLSIQMNIRGSIVEVTASGIQVGMHRDSVAKAHLISDSFESRGTTSGFQHSGFEKLSSGLRRRRFRDVLRV